MTIRLREKGALDPTKAQEGEWHEIFDGIWLKVAYASMERVRRVAQAIRNERGEAALRESERAQANGEEGTQEAVDNSVEMLARGLILDWSGVHETDSEGDSHAMPCTAENIRRVFSDTDDEDMSDLREQVALFAQNPDNFRVVREREALGKNSATASTGN